MNDYKPYKQLKQKQKAKVVERMYKELHQFFSDNQRFPDTPDEHELLARQIFSHIPYHVSFDEFYSVYNKKHSAIEQRLAEKRLPEHLLHREERRQEKLNRPAVKMTKPHRKKKKKPLHLVFVPLTEDNRLCAKEIIGNRANLTKWQDDFHAYIVEKLSVSYTHLDVYKRQAQGYSYKDGQLEKQQPEETPDSLLTEMCIRDRTNTPQCCKHSLNAATTGLSRQSLSLIHI